MAGTLDIAAMTRRLDVDNRLSVRFYYRTAANLLKQASIYREERNVIDLYILLLRFSSLVSETIPEHRDYRTTSPRERAEYKKKLAEVLGELEILKPEVHKQVERLNRAHRLPDPSASESVWADFTSEWLSAPTKNPSNGKELNKEIRQIESGGQHEPAAKAGDYWSSPTVSGILENHLSSLSLNIPRPKDETLSRHSIFGPNIPRRQNPAVPFRAQYPNYVDASPIKMPSLDQDWRLVPSQPHGVASSNAAQIGAEPILWPEADRRSFPAGYSPVIGPDLAPAPSLTRQPDPPPVAAPVHALESLDSFAQLASERVADPRPGPPQPLEHELGQEKGTKRLHISPRMMEDFLGLSRLNTSNNLETCAILAGFLKNGVFYVTTLIIPKQEATSDSCQTVNEEEIFEVQDKRGLFQLGWIHTHPTQICFMSSVDLHTHYSYQIMLQEAVAIVMAPTDTQRKYGIFRLSDPGGIKAIQQCDKRGFHPHEDLPDGQLIYEHCGHVFLDLKLKFDVIDLRQS